MVSRLLIPWRADHTADTFLRDMDLTVDGDKLKGQASFGEVVTVELTMQ